MKLGYTMVSPLSFLMLDFSSPIPLWTRMSPRPLWTWGLLGFQHPGVSSLLRTMKSLCPSSQRLIKPLTDSWNSFSGLLLCTACITNFSNILLPTFQSCLLVSVIGRFHLYFTPFPVLQCVPQAESQCDWRAYLAGFPFLRDHSSALSVVQLLKTFISCVLSRSAVACSQGKSGIG